MWMPALPGRQQAINSFLKEASRWIGRKLYQVCGALLLVQLQ